MSIVPLLASRARYPNRLWKENRAPVALISAAFEVEVGAPITVYALNGTTDIDGDPVTNVLTLHSKPGGSAATIDTSVTNQGTVTDTSVAGSYVFRNTATDDGGAGRGLSGSALSSTADVTITVVTPSAPPEFNAYNTLGVFRGGQSEAQIQTYESSTGINRTLPGPIVTTYNSTTWSQNYSDISSILSRFSNRVVTQGNSKLCLSLLFYPNVTSGYTVLSASTGAYNTNYDEIANRIAAAEYPDDKLIIRLPWEFNGNYFHWNITGNKDTTSTPARFAEACRQLVTRLRLQNPNLLIDWSPKHGGNVSYSTLISAYPGDDYIDTVGLQYYDYWEGYASTYPTHNDAQRNAAFDALVNDTKWGLTLQRQFAIDHGKTCTFFEWGCQYDPRTSEWADNVGLDNPIFITRSLNWFDDLGADGLLHSHCYYEHDQSDGYHRLHGGTYAYTNAKAAFDAEMKA